MIYPIKQYTSNENGSTSVFKGLNRTDKGQEGEWLEVSDLDTSHYPCLAPRIRHGEPTAVGDKLKISACAEALHDDGEYHGFTGVIFSKCCIDNTNQQCTNYCFYYRGECRGVGASDISEKPSRTALWQYNTAGDGITDDEKKEFYSDIEKRVQWTVITVGERYVINGYDAVLKRGKYFVFEPEKDGKDKTWVIPSDMQVSYSGLIFGYTAAANRGYNEYANINYIESSEHDFTTVFNEGDYLLISNANLPTDSGSAGKLKHLNTYPYDDEKLPRLVKYAVVRDVVQLGSGSRIYYYSTMSNGRFRTNINPYDSDRTTIKNVTADIGIFVPPMAHISAFGSRIWGVRPDEDSVYASVFDTPFKLMNTDAQLDAAMSWQCVIGTPDEAVGVFPLSTEMLVMKKNSLVRISGTSAASFTISGIFGNCGCIDIRSCAEAEGTVYYLGYNGFYAYDGSQPQIISSKLNCKYTSAAGFTDGNKYYASAIRSDTNEHEFLVYDIRRGIWLMWRDTPKIVGSFRAGDKIYMAYNYTDNDNDDEGYVAVICGGTEASSWSCESIEHYENANSFKAVNELWLRAYAEDEIAVETSVNGGEWKEHKRLVPKGRVYMYKLPIRLCPGDFWQYRLIGNGAAVIRNIERVYDSGGGRHYRD